MINLSSDIVTVLISNVSSMIQQLWIVFAFLIGVTMTFYIFRKIIFLITLSKR